MLLNRALLQRKLFATTLTTWPPPSLQDPRPWISINHDRYAFAYTCISVHVQCAVLAYSMRPNNGMRAS